MDGIDPATTLEEASQFGWAVYVLVLVLLMLFIGGSMVVTIWWAKIAVPESRKRSDLMDKASDALDAFSVTQSQTNVGIQELKQSHSTISTAIERYGDEGRRVVRCARVACELIERKDFENAHQYATRMRDILDEDS